MPARRRVPTRSSSVPSRRPPASVAESSGASLSVLSARIVPVLTPLSAPTLPPEGPAAPHATPDGPVDADADAARAFAVLYEAEWPALVRVACGVVHSRERAEDVVQTAALACLPHWPRVRAQAATLAEAQGEAEGNRSRAQGYERHYLHRAVKRRALSAQRSVAREAKRRGCAPDDYLVAPPIILPPEPRERSARAEETWQAVVAVCTERQRVILGALRDGQTINDIAAHLGLSRFTIMRDVDAIKSNGAIEQLVRELVRAGKVELP